MSEKPHFTGHTLLPEDTVFTINWDSEPIVTIHGDGTITYGKGYTPDAAAKVFWDAMGLERKERLP